MSSSDSDNDDIIDNEDYSAKELKQHILDIPDTYIGGVEPAMIENAWIYRDETLEQKDVTVSLGFYNIFNEILTNASDQCIRTREYAKKDKTVQITKTIKVEFNEETGFISVWNDGDGIPVKKHADKDIWIPELIFGTLLTSSNYDKKKLKVVGGKNGYGSKLCLKIGTFIPDYSGKFIKIEDVKIGDKLIGDDGLPRKVIGQLWNWTYL